MRSSTTKISKVMAYKSRTDAQRAGQRPCLHCHVYGKGSRASGPSYRVYANLCNPCAMTLGLPLTTLCVAVS